MVTSSQPGSDTNKSVSGVGGAKEVTINYDMPIFFTTVVPGTNSNGDLPLSVTAVMR